MTQLAFIYKCFSLYRLRRLGKPLLSALFVEVALQQAVKASAVAGFVFGHFVNAVVNGIVAEFLGQRGNLLLAVAGAEFCCRAHFNVLFRRVGNDFAQHLGDACGWSASSKA